MFENKYAIHVKAEHCHCDEECFILSIIFIWFWHLLQTNIEDLLMQASEALQSNLTSFAINSQAILDSIPQRIEEEGTSHVQGKLTFN